MPSDQQARRDERTRRGPARLAERVRLSGLLRPGRERRFARSHPQPYAEEEVRDRIYGWHSGTVEPPEPAGTREQRNSGRPAGGEAG